MMQNGIAVLLLPQAVLGTGHNSSLKVSSHPTVWFTFPSLKLPSLKKQKEHLPIALKFYIEMLCKALYVQAWLSSCTLPVEVWRDMLSSNIVFAFFPLKKTCILEPTQHIKQLTFRFEIQKAKPWPAVIFSVSVKQKHTNCRAALFCWVIMTAIITGSTVLGHPNVDLQEFSRKKKIFGCLYLLSHLLPLVKTNPPHNG